MAKRARRRPVGFIGVGTMGFPMASNLLERGFPLLVYDLDPRPLQALAARGARVARSVEEVGRACQQVITVLPGPAQVEAVVGALIEVMAPGGTLVEMSTTDPGTSRRLAARSAERGLRLLDAPVSGGPLRARDATLTIMVGGEASALAACRPVLEALGSHIVHAGPSGAGQTVKLVNNLIGAVTMVALAEALAIGVRAGASPQVLYDVISRGTGDSWILRNRFPYPGVSPTSPANTDFTPGFRLDLMHKDVSLALATAREVGAPTLLGGLVEQLYAAAQAQGWGDRDYGIVARLLERLAARGEAPAAASGAE